MTSARRPVESAEPAWAALPDGSARGVFGDHDVLGTLNRQSPQAVMQALASVRDGRVFSLNLPVTEPDPALYQRDIPRHTVYTTSGGHFDDLLDGFYPQGSSQWDGFLHAADPELGFYNGLGVGEHGIHHWAERGIVGRGVLLDLGELMMSVGGDDALGSRTSIDVDGLEAVRRAHGIEYRRGDILLLRTGWIAWYRRQNLDARIGIRDARTYPGIEGSDRMAEYLWDHGLAAVASDTPGVEALPSQGGSLHRRVLARLGMPLGELWWLDELAAACADRARHDFLLVSSPMNLVGGIGTPANATAVT